MVGYIQILATFTNAGTSSVYSDTADAVVKLEYHNKDNPAKLRLQSLLFKSLKHLVYFINSNEPATLLVNPEYEATAAPPDDHS